VGRICAPPNGFGSAADGVASLGGIMIRHIHFTVSVVAMCVSGALVFGGCSSSSGGGGTSSSSGSSSGGGESDTGSLGPGAAYMCTSSGKDAWDTYGAAAFVKVNQSIFANVTAQLADAGSTNLGDSFSKIGTGMPASTTDDAATFEGKLAAFLVYAYGGPTSIMYTDGKTYDGVQDMTAAHLGLAITMDQYNYFIANIVVPALTSNGVPMSDVTSCFAPVVTDASFVASIVGH
jgi:hypothetical protein